MLPYLAVCFWMFFSAKTVTILGFALRFLGGQTAIKVGPFWIDFFNILQDVYLQECLNRVGIWKADLKHLLAEDRGRGVFGGAGEKTMASWIWW